MLVPDWKERAMTHLKERIIFMMVIIVPLNMCLWYLRPAGSVSFWWEKEIAMFLVVWYVDVSAYFLSLLFLPPKATLIGPRFLERLR